MSYKHILIETYCLNNCNEEVDFCKDGINSIGMHCFHNNCKFLGTTFCPSEIAITNESGIVESLEDFIGFGGDMEINNEQDLKREVLLEKWYSICRSKINEAYEEYMNYKKILGSDSKEK